MRLGFAIAATIDPDVLLLDEIFAVGDADFQRQCMATLKSFQARGQDDRLRVALVGGRPGRLPPRGAPRSRSAAVRWRRGRGPDRVSPSDGARRRTRRSGPQPGETAEAAATRAGGRAPSIRTSRGTGWPPADSGRRRARGSSTSCAARDCGRVTTCSTSGAAASRPPAGCCPTWSRATTGASRRTSSSSWRARRSSCPASGVRRRARTLHRQRRLRLLGRAPRLRSRDCQLALPPPAAQQRRPGDRQAWCARSPPAVGSTRRWPRAPTATELRARSCSPAASRPTAIASRSTTASRCWRRSPRSSAHAPSASSDASHPRGESVMVFMKRRHGRRATRDQRDDETCRARVDRCRRAEALARARAEADARSRAS